MIYRREIDGLRAIAVLPVILFHAGFETFNGGFVGVDVFFVISGYLITTIITNELDDGKFSLVNFYERRARRILPALFLIMFFCIPFAWVLLSPSDLTDFSQSLIAVSIFASNIFFWRESGYFDAAAELKPLLHTWSLAVEEQFYLLFPLFLLLLWKLGKRLILIVMGFAFVFSLALAQWAVYAGPYAAFYLLPMRGWELLVGSFAAFYLRRNNSQYFKKGLNEFAGWLGLALIVFAIFAFNKETPFPGLYALVPTLGSLLIILFATQQTFIGKFVGNKIFVSIGLISYSAYLWHQPMFSFARHKNLLVLSNTLLLALSLLSLIFAYLSWKYVEIPFRKNKRVTRNQIFILSIFFTLTFIILGLIGQINKGFESRFDRVLSGDIGQLEFHQYLDERYFDCEPQVIAENALKWEGFLRCKQSKEGIPEVILLGDSHAEHLFLGLAEHISSKNIAFYIQGEQPYVGNEGFDVIFEELISNNKSQHIILTMHFLGREDEPREDLYRELSSTISALLNAGKLVTLVGDVPLFSNDPSSCVYSMSKTTSASCILTVDEVKRQRLTYDEVLVRLAYNYNLRYIRLDKVLCSDNYCSMSDANSILYRDRNHLNIPGSKVIGKYLAEKLTLS